MKWLAYSLYIIESLQLPMKVIDVICNPNDNIVTSALLKNVESLEISNNCNLRKRLK